MLLVLGIALISWQRSIAQIPKQESSRIDMILLSHQCNFTGFCLVISDLHQVLHFQRRGQCPGGSLCSYLPHISIDKPTSWLLLQPHPKARGLPLDNVHLEGEFWSWRTWHGTPCSAPTFHCFGGLSSPFPISFASLNYTHLALVYPYLLCVSF